MSDKKIKFVKIDEDQHFLLKKRAIRKRKYLQEELREILKKELENEADK